MKPVSRVKVQLVWKKIDCTSLHVHAMAEGESEVPCKDYQSWLAEPDESCKEFMMQQTMMRIKDPKASLDFYTRILGMRYVCGGRSQYWRYIICWFFLDAWKSE